MLLFNPHKPGRTRSELQSFLQNLEYLIVLTQLRNDDIQTYYMFFAFIKSLVVLVMKAQ